MSRLDEIFLHKRAEVAQRMSARPLADVVRAAADAAPPLDFVSGLRAASRPALIGEIKAESPSRGVLATDFDPKALARSYALNGAAAISVLTDERFFRGSLAYLAAARAATASAVGAPLPLLQKDFICSPYQVYEARAAGADCILLIVAALDPGLLRELHELALSLGMAALVEVHTAAELYGAVDVTPPLLGINARNLHDFSVSLDTTLQLMRWVPADLCLVAESGIHSRADITRLMKGRRAAGHGVDAVLVGEALVTAPDIAAKVRELSGGTA